MRPANDNLPARNILVDIRDAILASSMIAMIGFGCYLSQPHQPAEKFATRVAVGGVR